MDPLPPITDTVSARTRTHDFSALGLLIAGVGMFLLAGVLAFPVLVEPIQHYISTHITAHTLPHAWFLRDDAQSTTILTIAGGDTFV